MKYLPILATAVVFMAAISIAAWLMTPQCAISAPPPPIPKEDSATLTLVNNTPYWLIVAVKRTADDEPFAEELLSPNTIPQIPGESPTNIVIMTLPPDIYDVLGILCRRGLDGGLIRLKICVTQVTLTPGAHKTRIMGLPEPKREEEVET